MRPRTLATLAALACVLRGMAELPVFPDLAAARGWPCPPGYAERFRRWRDLASALLDALDAADPDTAGAARRDMALALGVEDGTVRRDLLRAAAARCRLAALRAGALGAFEAASAAVDPGKVPHAEAAVRAALRALGREIGR